MSLFLVYASFWRVYFSILILNLSRSFGKFSGDPDQVQHSVASVQGLHCKPMSNKMGARINSLPLNVVC